MNIVIYLLIATTLSFNLEQQQTAYIIEYITPFDIPVNDLQEAILNQLSRNDFLTPSFTTDHVKVTNLIYKTYHNTSSKIIDPVQQSYKHIVSNDGIDLFINYTAVVNHNLVDHKQYKCNTSVKIYINYTKQIDEEGATEIFNLSIKIDNSSFVMKYSDNPSPNDLKKLNEINNGIVSGKNNITILKLLENQQFTHQIIVKYFNQNLKAQKISPTYQRYYNYKYDNINLVFDMSTANIEPINHGISHYIKGTIKNYNINLQNTQKFIKDNNNIALNNGGQYHTLLTLDFINNFVKYSVQQYKNWQNILINQQKYPNSLFKYKLIGLQGIIDNIVQKYAKFYLNQFYISCKVVDFNGVNIDQDNGDLNLNLQWRCKTYLTGPKSQTIINDFNITLNNIVQISILTDTLYVLIEKCNILSISYNQVQNFKVLQPQIMYLYIKQILNRFETSTIGTNFKIKQGSQQLFYKENQGIYIR